MANRRQRHEEVMRCKNQVQTVVVAAAKGDCPVALKRRISATPRIPAWPRVDDPPIHVADLEAFPRLRIEVNSRDGPAAG
jgi:hypothetical protein